MIKKIKLKTILIILFVLVSVASLFFIFYSNNKKVETPKQTGFPSLKMDSYYKGNPAIEMSLKDTDFDNFPKFLPYLKQEPLNPFSLSEMSTIAANFGYKTDPFEANDVTKGKFYVWSGDTFSLIIYSKIRNIEHTPSINPKPLIENAINKQLDDNYYKNLAINLVSEKFGVSKDNLKFSNFIYLKTESGLENYRVTTKEDSEITQVNLYFSGGSFPIFTTTGLNSQIYVQFTRDGEVLYINASFFSEYKNGENEYKIKDYNEVKETIKDAILVGLNDSNVNLPDLKSGDIRKIKINSVSLVYLQDSLSSDVLQPVFLLQGTASVTGFVNEISASLYLPAYSNK